jgi:hypothetical protein
MAWINGRFRAADTWALGPLAAVPGLIDEYLLVVHPAVLTAGPRLFGRLPADLALRLLEAKAFEGGAVVLRYAAVRSWRSLGHAHLPPDLRRASEVHQEPQAVLDGAQHSHRHAADRTGAEPLGREGADLLAHGEADVA